MMERKVFVLVVLMTLILFAGCSGVLSGGNDGATSTQTPVASPVTTTTATPTPTEASPTATPTPTQTPTPTPSPKIDDHRLLARQIATGLQEHGADEESWVRDVSAGVEYSAILVRQPPEWTIKRTEMEAVREAVRGVILGTGSGVNPGETNGSAPLHRPDEIRIVVQNQDGEITSRISLDTGFAVDYADRKISLEEFASRLNETREVERDVPLGENSTAYYLKMAEWRQIRGEQVEIINNSPVTGTNETVDIDHSEVRVEASEIYYRYSPANSTFRVIRDGTFLRTYWEAIRNVSRQRLVHRFPERMRVYAAVPGDEDVETTIRTEYAFDFIRATDGDISDENILTNGAYNLYYPKKNVTRYPDR